MRDIAPPIIDSGRPTGRQATTCRRSSLAPVSTVAVIIVALAVLVAYGRAWRELRRRDGPDAAPGRRLGFFAGGVLVAVVAVGDPLDSLADDSLLVAHAVQLLLLTCAAPPLLVAGIPEGFVAHRGGRPLLRLLANPLACLGLFIAVLWLWHVPPMFDAASSDPALRWLQHASLLAAGVLLAWPLAGPLPGLRRRLSGMRQLVYLASGELAIGALGLWLAWYPSLVFSGYGTGDWGLSPTSDQALAGAILLVVAEPLVVIEVAVIFIRLLDSSQDDDDDAEATRARPVRS